jgi:stage II sporulation protein AA (anti-sigma F factor antagonist)
MTIVHMLDGTRLILAVNGDLDLTTAQALTEALDDLLNHFPQKVIVLELSAVDFIDSSGLGVILGRYRRLHQQGRTLELAGVRARLRPVLEIAGISQLISVSYSIEKSSAHHTS